VALNDTGSMARLRNKTAIPIGALFGRLMFCMSDSNYLTKKNFSPLPLLVKHL
jgi:hypothetical protein